GIVGSGVIVQRRRPAIGREIVGAEPVLSQDDAVGRQASNIFDEAREMKRDLWIGRLIKGARWGDRLGLTEMINFHDPRSDRALGRLPNQTCSKSAGQQQASESHHPPIPGLEACGANTIVPNLRCLLVRRHGLWRAAVMHGWSFEHQCPPSDRSTEAPPPALSPLRTAWVAADTPWFTVCARFMRRAQAGTVSVVDEPPPSPAAIRRSG